MIRMVLFFIAVGLLAAGVAWMADRPGDLTLNWLGYRIEISIMAAAVILLVMIGCLVFFWSLVASLIASPGMLTGLWRARRREKGMTALTQGIIAVSAGDVKAATRFSSKANKIIGDQALTLLLKAQTAQLRGDKAGARRAFEAMLKSPETQSLGLRGLYVEAQRENDHDAAMAYAKRALEDNSATEWAATALFDMQCAQGDWVAALKTLATNQRNKHIDKPTAQRWRAVLLTGQAMQLEDTGPDEALELAQEANNLAPDLVPAAVIAGRLYGQQQNMRKATRILENAWQRMPHPEIAAAYSDVRSGDSVRDRLERITSLAARTPGNHIGAMAVAEAAIDALDWKLARETLAPHISQDASERPNQRMCALMAEIEEGEHGDRGRAREWLARAVRAPRDPAWTADGIVAPHWAPISPVTGRIDAFEWKIPVERIGVFEDEMDIEPIATIEPVIVEPEAIDIESESIEEEQKEPVEEIEEETEESNEAPQKEEKTEISPVQASPSETEVRELLDDPKKPEIPRAPDDPGPEAAEIIDEDKRYKTP